MLMVGANTLEMLILLRRSFHSKSQQSYTICPPSGWVSPWTVLPPAITPTPTPVPMVTYTKDCLIACLPILNSASAAAFTSVSIATFTPGKAYFTVSNTFIPRQSYFGVVVIDPKRGLSLSKHKGPKEAIPIKKYFYSSSLELTAGGCWFSRMNLIIYWSDWSGSAQVMPFFRFRMMKSVICPLLLRIGSPMATLKLVPPSSIPTNFLFYKGFLLFSSPPFAQRQLKMRVPAAPTKPPTIACLDMLTKAINFYMRSKLIIKMGLAIKRIQINVFYGDQFGSGCRYGWCIGSG